MASVLITCAGSLGDLNPYLALAQQFRARGHRVHLATVAPYRSVVEELGFSMSAIGQAEMPAPAQYMAINHPRRGVETIIRQYLLPSLEGDLAVLKPLAQAADIVISHPLTLATPLAAELAGRPWLSTVLAPLSLMSFVDPPVLAPAPWMAAVGRRWPRLYRWIYGRARRPVDRMLAPWHELRRSAGLPPQPDNPMLEGQFSPYGTLALFSRQFADDPGDWPAGVKITGFAAHDAPMPDDEAARLAAFLSDGPPPLVFTLGSAVVHSAPQFFPESLKAARRMQRRALLVGTTGQALGLADSRDIACFRQIPYGTLFPQAAAIIHQGGIGTLSRALASGRPMVVCPQAHDQFDNARQAKRLGVAEVLAMRCYSARRVVPLLDDLLASPEVSEAGHRLALALAAENGAAEAVAVTEMTLAWVAARQAFPEATRRVLPPG